LTKRSSTKQPPKNWVFFTDRDLGNAIPDSLEAAGHAVERAETHFVDTKTRDEVWLPHVAAQGWLALTHDKKILRVKIERDAAMNSGLALFLLIGSMPHADLAKNLIATIPQILRFRVKHDPPFIARVHRCAAKFSVGTKPGIVEMALTKAQWLTLLKQGK
jgi:hypothetical protein